MDVRQGIRFGSTAGIGLAGGVIASLVFFPAERGLEGGGLAVFGLVLLGFGAGLAFFRRRWRARLGHALMLLIPFAVGLGLTGAWSYWQANLPFTVAGSNPFVAPRGLEERIASFVKALVRSVLIVGALVALLPPFGGRRGRTVAAGLGAGYVAWLLLEIESIVESYRRTPDGYEWGLGLVLLFVLLLLAAPVLVAVVRALVEKPASPTSGPPVPPPVPPRA